jgi:hypothetical protein
MSSNAGKTPRTLAPSLPVTFKWIRYDTLERYKAGVEQLRFLRELSDKVEDTSDLMMSEYPNSLKDFPVGKHAKAPDVTLNDFKCFVRNYFKVKQNVSAYDVYESLAMKNDELSKLDFEYFKLRNITQHTYNKMRKSGFFLTVKPLHQWGEWLD